jgi:hypothetical protein
MDAKFTDGSEKGTRWQPVVPTCRCYRDRAPSHVHLLMLVDKDEAYLSASYACAFNGSGSSRAELCRVVSRVDSTLILQIRCDKLERTRRRQTPDSSAD